MEEEDTEEDQTNRKSKFLEKRKTFEFHEYPKSLPLTELDENEDNENKEDDLDNEEYY